MTADPRQVAVEVDGGRLAVLTWGPASGPGVIAVHGITANARYWSLVGRALADRGVRLVAPDLRGRGGSAALAASSSIGRHAEDVWAVVDAMGLQEAGLDGAGADGAGLGGAGGAVLVGHSMGGFVVATAAARRPGSTRRVVLVDGGPPLTGSVPAPDAVEGVLDDVIGPALRRLDRTFPDRDAYRRFWAEHPGMAAGTPGWLLDAYADHDLRPAGDRWRSRVDRDAVVADARDTLTDEEVLTAVSRLTTPTLMLVAERGVLDDPAPLYPDGALDGPLARQPHLAVRRVAATNHYTIGTSPAGAAAVAAAALDALGLGPDAEGDRT